MGRRKSFDLGEMGRRLAIIANWVVRICGGAIFLFLTWYSMRYTQYINPGGDEIPLNVHDSMLQNVFVLLIGIVVFFWLIQLEKHVAERIQRRIKLCFLVGAMLWVGALGIWWITSAERIPQGDQAFIYGGASYFLEGKYFFLSEGGYCEMYPHQLGLIALMEVLFLFVGKYNFFAFQFLCVMMAAAIVYMGYQIVQCITERMSAAVWYCVAMMGCLPLIFYTGWVYGDIPSIFFSMLAARMLLCYSRREHSGYLAAVVVALSFDVLVRKNAWIFVIAFCIIALVMALHRKNRKLIWAALLSVAIPLLMYAGIYKMYEVRSGYAHSKGLPPVTWVAMGLQETNGKYGWYNNYPKQLYYELGCDLEMTAELAKQDVKDRLHYFKENPSYAVTFFREKMLSQWNEPLCQSIFFNTKYQEEHRPEEGSFVLKISGEYFTQILRLCDRLQFVLYFGMLLYFIFGVTPRSRLSAHFLAVAIIGGFLFSIFWEAKARYILPYYITMFSLASLGYYHMLMQVSSLFKRGKTEVPDNITKFRRAS